MPSSSSSPRRSSPATRAGLDFGAGSAGARPRAASCSAATGPAPSTSRARDRGPRRSAATDARHVVIGVIEREGGTLYCSVLFFGPDGTLLGKHRKLMPTAAERLVWGFGDGSTMPVFDTAIGRLGAAICWENYMPLLRMAMYARGSSSTAPRRPTTARPGSRRCGTSPWRAAVSSSRATSSPARADYPADYPAYPGGRPGDGHDARRGAASSTRWAGSWPARLYDGRTSSRPTSTWTRSAAGKFDFDVVGHYARPDVFRLIVNTVPDATGHP